MAASTRSLNRGLAALGAVALVSVGVLTLGSTPTYAADQTFEVTEPVTSLPPQPGELGWAIEQANATAGKDTIDIQTSAIQLGSNLPTITDDVTILGNGATIDGYFWSYSAFAITAASAEISNIEVVQPNSAGVYAAPDSGDTIVLSAIDVTNASSYPGISIYPTQDSIVRVAEGTLLNNNIGLEISGWGGGTVEITGTRIDASRAYGVTVTASSDTRVTIDSSEVIGDATSNSGINAELYGNALLAVRATTVSAHGTSGLNAMVYGDAELELAAGTVLSNNAQQGAYVYASGSVLFDETTVADNGFDDDSAGIDIDRLYDDGSATISRSTISNNAGDGVVARIVDDSALDIGNSTISGNYRNGIDVESEGTFLLRHSTLAKNNGGGIRLLNDDEQASISHTIVAANERRQQESDLAVYGANVTLEWSVVGTFSDDGAPSTPALVEGPGVQWDVLDPRIEALTDNGGRTLTHRLGDTSPALDAGNASIANASTTDQRALPRIVGSRIDIGAVEIQLETDASSASPAALLPATGREIEWPIQLFTGLLACGLGLLGLDRVRRQPAKS
ncbi:MAG: right-handed parallel beta-helix repeat-containing protein [Rhodoglobus sp.]